MSLDNLEYSEKPLFSEGDFIAADNDAKMLSIKQLMVLCHKIAQEKGWWDKGPRNDGELLMLMVSELAEGYEFLRNNDGQSDHIPEFKGIEEELADVLIRVFDYAEQRGYNLPQALMAKIAFNETRPYRHGGKTA